MRFVLGTPTQHSIFGSDHTGDDAVASMAASPVRRGTSWLVAMVTQRMRFLVFSCERSSPWSRRVIGQLPVAAGAVTEGPSSTHNNNSNNNNNKNNNNNNSSLGAAPVPSTTQNSNNEEQELLRIVESPISIHFHHRGKRIVIATSVRRLLILEIDADQGNYVTPLAHQLSDESQYLFGNANINHNHNNNNGGTTSMTSSRISLVSPLPDMQTRWCVVCEIFLPQGLIQHVDTSCGGNVFSVCSSSGHIFVVSWLNGHVLHEVPVTMTTSVSVVNSSSSSLQKNVSGLSADESGQQMSSAIISSSCSVLARKKFLNNLILSPRLRLGAISFLDGSVAVVGPKLFSPSSKDDNDDEKNDLNNNNNAKKNVATDEQDQTGGASIPLDMALPDIQLHVLGEWPTLSSVSSSSDSSSSQSKKLSNTNISAPHQQFPVPQSPVVNNTPTASTPSSSSYFFFQQHHDSASIVRFLSFNNKHKTLTFCGGRLSTFNIVDVSGLADDPNSFVNVAAAVGGEDSKMKSVSSSSDVLLLVSFHNLSQSIRNTLLEIAPCPINNHHHHQYNNNSKQKSSSAASTGTGTVNNNNNTSASFSSPTFKQLGFGELKSLTWSPDEEVLSLTFSNSGICIFDISGVLLFHSWKNTPISAGVNPSTASASSTNSSNINLHTQNFDNYYYNNNNDVTSNGPNPDNSNATGVGLLLPLGSLASLWIDSKRIVALDRFGANVSKIEIAVASTDHANPQSETDGNSPILVGTDTIWQYRTPKLVNDYVTIAHSSATRALLMKNNKNNINSNNEKKNQGSSILDMITNSMMLSDGTSCSNGNYYFSSQQQLSEGTSPAFWEKISVPEIYIARNYPLRFAVASPDGSSIIICGRRGFVLWNNQTQKWKTFLDVNLHSTASTNSVSNSSSNSEQQNVHRKQLEQSFSVISSPVWIGNQVIAVPCELTSTVPGKDTSCKLGSPGQGAILFFSAHVSQVLDYHIDERKNTFVGNTVENSALLEMLNFSDSTRPLLLTASYRGGSGVENGSKKGFTNAANHSYLLTIVNALGTLSLYNISTLLVSNDIYDQVHVGDSSRSSSAKIFSLPTTRDPCFSVKIRLTPLSNSLRTSHSNLLGVPFITKDQAKFVVDKASEQTKQFAEQQEKERRERKEEEKILEEKKSKNEPVPELSAEDEAKRAEKRKLDEIPLEQLKAKVYNATVGFSLKKLQTSEGFFISQPSDIKQIYCLAPYLGMNPSPLANNNNSNNNHQAHESSNISSFFPHNSSFYLIILLHCGRLLLLDLGNKSHQSMFHQDHGILFGEIMNAKSSSVPFTATAASNQNNNNKNANSFDVETTKKYSGLKKYSPTSFITKMWPVFSTQSAESKPIETILTFGSSGLCGKSFLVSSRLSLNAFSDSSLAAAQRVFHPVCPTLFGVFRTHTNLSPFDSETIPIAVCGSMPLWCSPKSFYFSSAAETTTGNNSNNNNYYSSRVNLLPSFDVTAQLSIVLHLNVILPLIVGSYNFALLKTQQSVTNQSASSAPSGPSSTTAAATTLVSTTSTARTRNDDEDEIQESILSILRSLSDQLKRQKSLIESFDCILYTILHTNIQELLYCPESEEDLENYNRHSSSNHNIGNNNGNNVNNNNNANRAPDKRRQQILQTVISFLRSECTSQDFFDICVLALRKTDEARCGPLFDVLGSPLDMFDHCVSNNHLLSALHLLRVIQMYADHQKSKQIEEEFIRKQGNNPSNTQLLHQQQQQNHQMKTIIADVGLIHSGRAGFGNNTNSATNNQHHPLIHSYNSAKKLFGKVLRQYDQTVAIDLLRYLVLIQNELIYLKKNIDVDDDENKKKLTRKPSIVRLNKQQSSSTSPSSSSIDPNDETVSFVKLPAQQQEELERKRRLKQQQEDEIALKKRKEQEDEAEKNKNNAGIMSTVTNALWSMFTFGSGSSISDAVHPAEKQNNTTGLPTTTLAIASSSTPSSPLSSGAIQQQPQQQSFRKTSSTSQNDLSANIQISPTSAANSLQKEKSGSLPSTSTFPTSFSLDAPPSALLLANEDLMEEVLNVAEIFMPVRLFTLKDETTASRFASFCPSSMLKVFSFFDGFGLDVNFFFQKRYKRLEDQLLENLLVASPLPSKRKNFLSYFLGSLLTELGLPDAEFVSHRVASCSSTASATSKSKKSSNIECARDVRKLLLKNNECGLLTPTQVALLERTDGYIETVIIRMRNVFLQNNCVIYLLVTELILMNVNGIRKIFDLQQNESSSAWTNVTISFLKQEFFRMINSEEVVCQGYKSMLEKL